MHSSCISSRLDKQKDYIVQRAFVRNTKIPWSSPELKLRHRLGTLARQKEPWIFKRMYSPVCYLLFNAINETTPKNRKYVNLAVSIIRL